MPGSWKNCARVDQMSAFLFRARTGRCRRSAGCALGTASAGVDGSVLDGTELRDAGELLRGRSAHRSPCCSTRRTTRCSRRWRALVRLDDEERRIRAAIDEAGDVRDSASRELNSRLRREIRGARNRIVERLEQYIASLPARFQVRTRACHVRDGRYVIPVRREGRGEVGGLVHDESATGNTLFVEPPVALELMNRLRELEIAEAREVQRILRELTEHAAAAQPA
jgi:DNA mismatch repair protein MutS2